jgi:hypothetical protein
MTRVACCLKKIKHNTQWASKKICPPQPAFLHDGQHFLTKPVSTKRALVEWAADCQKPLTRLYCQHHTTARPYNDIPKYECSSAKVWPPCFSRECVHGRQSRISWLWSKNCLLLRIPWNISVRLSEYLCCAQLSLLNVHLLDPCIVFVRLDVKSTAFKSVTLGTKN